MRGRTILLVDDEAEIRAVIAAALDDGYTVLQAETGYEAVGVLAENWVDLLLTDVRMPGIDGFELARQSKVMRPTIEVVYFSGYGNDSSSQFGNLHGPIGVGQIVRQREVQPSLQFVNGGHK